MRIISKKRLADFWSKHRRAEVSLRAWHSFTKAAKWQKPNQIREDFRSADVLPNNRVVFDIGGNEFRIVAKLNYKAQILYIRFVGTHSQYDKIDANTI